MDKEDCCFLLFKKSLMHRRLWVWSFKAAVTVTTQRVVRGAECTNVFLLLLWMYSVWTEPMRSAFRSSGERSIVVKVTLKCSQPHITVCSAGFTSFIIFKYSEDTRVPEADLWPLTHRSSFLVNHQQLSNKWNTGRAGGSRIIHQHAVRSFVLSLLQHTKRKKKRMQM